MSTLRGARLALGALAFALACGAGPPGPTISADALAARMRDGKAPVILDVRTPAEHAAGRIPGSVNIPYDEVAGRRSEIPAAPEEEIVVHCRSGKRAALAESALRELGFSRVRDLEGHMQAWEAAGLPVER